MKEDAKFKNAEVRKQEFNWKMQRKRVHKQRKIDADPTVEEEIGEAETNDVDIGEGDDGKRELTPRDPGVGALGSIKRHDGRAEARKTSVERTT